MFTTLRWLRRCIVTSFCEYSAQMVECTAAIRLSLVENCRCTLRQKHIPQLLIILTILSMKLAISPSPNIRSQHLLRLDQFQMTSTNFIRRTQTTPSRFSIPSPFRSPIFLHYQNSYRSSFSLSHPHVLLQQRLVFTTITSVTCKIPLMSQGISCCAKHFHTAFHFIRYCDKWRGAAVCDKGWVRAIINQTCCLSNHSGFFRCSFDFVKGLHTKRDVTCTIISLLTELNRDGFRLLGSPWCGRLYESYATGFPSGKILLIDFYSVRTTLSKSGKQRTTIVRVTFDKLWPYSDQWFTIVLAPNSESIPRTIPERRRRQCKLHLYHRFLFLAFQSIIRVFRRDVQYPAQPISLASG